MSKLKPIWFAVLCILTIYALYGFYDAGNQVQKARALDESKHMYGNTYEFTYLNAINFPMFIFFMVLLFGWLPFGLSMSKNKQQNSASNTPNSTEVSHK